MAKNAATGRREQSRRSNKLTPSKGSLKSVAQVSHLDGHSRKHALDVASSHKLRTPEEVKVNLEEAALLESYFHGTGPHPELVINVWFGDTGVGFKSPDGHDGTPVDMPGVEWQDVILAADAARMEWRDKSDKLRHPARGLDPELKPKNGAPPFDISDVEKWEQEHFFSFKAQGEVNEIDEVEDIDEMDEMDVVDVVDVVDKHDQAISKMKSPPEMSGQLKKIYARLPPWVALEAGKEMDRGTLVKAVAEVALAFQKESGHRVIAANIHVETEYDLHIHLVYTAIVPGAVTKKPYTPKTAANKLAPQRKMARALLLKRGIAKPTNKQVDAELAVHYKLGKLENPRLPRVKHCYQRLPLPPGARERLPSMGPGYCSKTVLWEASGRDPAVAAVNEREMTFNFRNVVVSKTEKSPIPGEAPLEPEDTYIDYWLWKKWTSVIVSNLSAAALQRLPQSAREHVDRYIQTADSLPNPALETARKKADKYVFTQLDEFRKGLGGSKTPSLKKEEKTVARAMQDIKATLDSIAKSETIRGLKTAFAVVFPWKEAETESPKEIEEQITSGITSIKNSAILTGFKLAFTRLFPERDPEGNTAEEIRKEITDEIAAQKDGAILAGFKTAYAWLFPGSDPQGKTRKAVRDEIQGAITGKLADGFRAILKVFGHDLPKITSPDELEKKVVIAAGEFKKQAQIDGLEIAWRAIKAPDVPVPTNLDAETLRGEMKRIQQESVARKTALDNLTIELETDRKRMSRIPVRELCEKLGFVVDKDDNISATLEHHKVKGTEFPHRGSIKGESFELEVFHHHHLGHGKHAWVKRSPGKGAIDFMHSLMPDLNFAEVCTKLAKMFPDREGGILLDHVSNKGGDLWNSVFQSPPPKKTAPQKTAEPQIGGETTTKDDIET